MELLPIVSGYERTGLAGNIVVDIVVLLTDFRVTLVTTHTFERGWFAD